MIKKRLQAFKFQLRPNIQQELDLATFSDGTVYPPVNSFKNKPAQAGNALASVKPKGKIKRQLAEIEAKNPESAIAHC
ncbi:MAG: virulence protein [Serratia symbiotica]|nr:virulence protein [Serratia symbiotica]